MWIHLHRRRVVGVAAAGIASLCSGLANGADENANAQHAHVHGVATLGIAVERDILTISFESPLDSLIGFEHRPNTPQQRAAVVALQSRLAAPTNLFRMTPAAECKLQKADAQSALFEPAKAGAADEHADLDASFEFRCAHAERLQSIDTGLFDAFPRLHRVTVAVATGKGQSKHDLQRPDRTIELAR